MGTVITLEEAKALPAGSQLKQWAYNGLDCTGTREVFDVLHPRLNAGQRQIYAFERALQAPSLSMSLRGIRVDRYQRDAMVKELERELRKDLQLISKLPLVADYWKETELETGWCSAAPEKHHKWPRAKKGEPKLPEETKHCERCGTPRLKPSAFNANSHDQVAKLLYEIHSVPVELNKKKEPTTDDDALVRISRKHPHVRPLVNAIRGVRDKKKQLGSLSAPLTKAGRYDSSFNVGAAWTGRFSSSASPYRTGGNLQNVAPRHRRVFIADPNQELFYPDYMQGESNVVAHVSGDEKYIEAHRVGDVHTLVARLVWPELPWTGDLAKDKKVASQNPPWDPAEGHSYRFHSKGVQHGSNFGLTPFGISIQKQIPLEQAKRAYEKYMTEFDGIPAWQNTIEETVRKQGWLTNPLGRSVMLFGRPWDKHTIRQGLSFIPQSTLADLENVALWNIWYYLEREGIYLMAQVHDAMVGQYPQGRLDLVHSVLKKMQITVPVTDIHGKTRNMTIGVEGAVGKNWGKRSEKNPLGIDEHPIMEYLIEHPL